jgi:hypothetical protein
MNNYGILLNNNAKLHRHYFKEMIKLIGINVIYRAPKQDKHWTTYGEIESNYQSPLLTGCIFDEHPNQYTMKKLGWVSELQEDASLISVPYDLPDIQVGALFIVPSGIDNTEGRLFRVTRLSNSMIYPSSVTCEIVPEYKDTYSPSLYEHKHNSFNLLNEDGDGNL